MLAEIVGHLPIIVGAVVIVTGLALALNTWDRKFRFSPGHRRPKRFGFRMSPASPNQILGKRHREATPPRPRLFPR
jgi:hypothetical protein